MQRLKRRYRPDSAAWVHHGNRGRPMPWAVSLPQKQWILTLARGKYQGFNNCHLAEKLRDEENLPLSRETVRRILRATSDFRPLPRCFDLARCLSLRYQRVVAADHTLTLGGHSIALPPLLTKSHCS